MELRHPTEEKKIVHYGAAMANDLDMGLILTCHLKTENTEYVYGTSIAEVYTRYDPAQLLKEQEDLIHSALSEHQKEINQLKHPPPSVEIHILRNSYAENPASNAEENDIDFILLPRKNILSTSLFTLSRVDTEPYEFNQTPMPVHPENRSYSPVNRILYCTNYNSYDLEVLKKLSGIFGKNETEIIALHITDDLDFEEKIKQAGYEQVVRNSTGNSTVNINTLVTRDKTNIANNLRSYAFEKNADMIAVLMENKSILEEILQPDIISDLTAEAELPLMIFRE